MYAAEALFEITSIPGFPCVATPIVSEEVFVLLINRPVIEPPAKGNLVESVALPEKVVAVTVPGKLVLPEPSKRVAVLVKELNVPVYCLT